MTCHNLVNKFRSRHILFYPCRLATLLAKFRLDFSDLIIITDVMVKAKDGTRELFDSLIRDYKKMNDALADDGTIFYVYTCLL